MQPANFNTLVQGVVQVIAMYLTYLAVVKASKDYFETRVAEADKKSFSNLIGVILKDIAELKSCNEKGIANEKEMRGLIDRLIADLRFIMEQIMESAFPKQVRKQEKE